MGDQCKRYFQLGTAAVVLLVILRLSLGCHFLYEGVWKIKHPEFSAEGFLTQAKGPAAPIFHAMVPDIDGRERLKIEKLVTAQSLLDRWKKVRDRSAIRWTQPIREEMKKAQQNRVDRAAELSKEENEDQRKAIERRIARFKAGIDRRILEFERDTNPILWEHEDRLEAFIAKNEEAILGYFAASDESRSQGNLKSWMSTMADIQRDYFAALEAFAEKDKDIKDAVARSIAGAAPLFDEAKPVQQFVGNSRLLDTEGTEIVRATRAVRAARFYEPWKKLKEKAVEKYDLDDRQQVEAEVVFRRYKEAVKSVLAENQADIAAYFGALDRLEKKVETGNQGAAHQKQRVYDERQKLLAEVRVWLAGLEATEEGYRSALAGLLTAEQAKKGALRESWTRTDLINLAVTYGLTAIGLCLLLGLFTRPAAVAGGLFMFSVILTQPNWPGIYPPASPEAGHALLINKDFVEMIALFALAATPVGRWGGLDFFVENLILRLLRSRKNRKG